MDLRLINPRKYRQLFLDDGAIESQKGTRRTLHPPKKCGPLIKGGYQSRTAPQWNADKGIWEWWYMGQHIHYARSTDGQNWEQPALGLYEVNGSRENNIVCDPEGGHQQRLYHVLYDPSDPDPKRRYKGLFSSSNRYLGTSAGQMLDAPPIPSQDEFQFTYDPFSQQYLATVKQGTAWGRSVFLSTSKDFASFTEPELILHSDETDWENYRQRVRLVTEDPGYIMPPLIDQEDYVAESTTWQSCRIKGFILAC